MKNAVEIAARIAAADMWNQEDLNELVELAAEIEPEIMTEWENADGETFEAVVYKAAEVLNVEI